MELRKYKLAAISNRYSIPNRQTKIAEVCGVTQKTVSKWWNILYHERDSIPSDHLKKIADHFKVTMEDLYTKQTETAA